MSDPNRSIGKYLRVSELHPLEGRKTKRWVLENTDGQQLGDIAWHGPWRAYVVEPRPGCVFHDGCLRDIADFLTSVRGERVS